MKRAAIVYTKDARMENLRSDSAIKLRYDGMVLEAHQESLNCWCIPELEDRHLDTAHIWYTLKEAKARIDRYRANQAFWRLNMKKT